MRHLLIVLLVFTSNSPLYAQQAPYKNSKLSPEARAKDLLSRMTLDEKLMQTQCLWIQKSTLFNPAGDFDPVKAESGFRYISVCAFIFALQ